MDIEIQPSSQFDLTTTGNQEVSLNGKKYHITTIIVNNIPLGLPVVSEKPISPANLSKVGNIITKLITEIQLHEKAKSSLGGLLRDYLVDSHTLTARGKGNAEAVIGGDWKGENKQSLLNTETLLSLLGYPINTDKNGNYTMAQEWKEKLAPNLGDQRFLGVFTDWIKMIAQSTNPPK